MRLQTKINLSIMPLILAAIMFLALWSAKVMTWEVERNFYYQMEVAIKSYFHEQLERRTTILDKNGLLNVASFVDMYKRNALEHAEKHLLDPDDTILVFNDEGKVLTAGFKEDDAGPIYRVLEQSFTGRYSGDRSIEQGTVEWNNRHMLYSVGYYRPWRWTVLYLRNIAELQEKIRWIYTVHAFAAGIVVIAVNLVVLIVLRLFFLKPLMLIHEATELIGNTGEFDAIAFSSKDELGMLARQMEKMAGRIYRYDDVQKKLQEEAMDSKERLQLIIDSANLGTWEWDISSGSLILNDRWAQMAGYDLGELEQNITTFENLVYPEDYKRLSNRLSEHVAGDETLFTAEYRLKHKLGYWLWVLAVGKVFRRDADGRGIRAAGIQIDISKQKAAEEELRSAMVKAEDANNAKLAFLSNMSHELRTPLNAILGYAELLRVDRQLSEKQLSGIETIYKSGENLLMLINDILDFSRIESGKLELVESELGLEQLLTGIRDVISHQCDTKGLEFYVELSGDLPEIIVVDGLRLRQILLNLLTNAVKFTDRGFCRLKASCSGLSPGRVRLTFTVEDSGVGIVQELQKKVFEPFQQNEERLRYIEGSGLGLAISQYLVNQMGGELQLISPLHPAGHEQYGPGCRFTFFLNCQAVKQPQNQSSGDDRVAVTSVDGSRKKILVVDDQLSNRMLLYDNLKLMNFDVRAEESAVRILQICYDYQPDIIFLDMRMPVVDGLTALGLLKNDSRLAHIPVVATSASSADEQGRSLRDSSIGFAGYLAKPYKSDALVELLADLLDIRVLSGDEGEKLAVSVELPPESIISSFQEHFNVGDIDAIIAEADNLASAFEGRYARFAQKIKKLAVDIQLVAIERLLSGKL